MADWSRRRLLAAAASAGTVAGCGYRPGRGDTLWKHETRARDHRPRLHVVGDVVVGAYEWVPDWESEEAFGTGGLVAYDRRTGNVRWERRYREGNVLDSLDDGTGVYALVDGGKIVAVDASGTERWRTSPPSAVNRFARSGDRLYAASDTAVVALDADSGETLWRREVVSDGPVAATPDGVYLSKLQTFDGPGLVAYTSDGEEKWSFDDRESVDTSFPSLTAHGGVVVFSTAETTAVAERDGSRLWRTDSFDSTTEFVATTGRVYHTERDVLYARDSTTGRTEWEFGRFPGRSNSKPVVGEDAVFVSGTEGFFAVSRADGTLRWSLDGELLPVADTSPALTTDSVIQAGTDWIHCFKRT